MNFPLTVVQLLGLTKSAPASQISKAIEHQKAKFEDFLRLIPATPEETSDEKQAAEDAKALPETRGGKQGTEDSLDQHTSRER